MNNGLSGGGEMGERIRAFDWATTPLGPIEAWPQSLKTAVQIILGSRQPFWLGWGDQLVKLYNDPYKAIVGGKHPTALGQPAAVVWREIWDAIGPMLQTAMGGIEGTYVEAQLLIMERNGYPEETYYTFSYSPIHNDQGGVGGIICANTDDTQRVIGERQLALLRELAAKTADARTVAEACTLSTDCLATNPYDLPFAMIYMVDEDGQRAVLAGNGSGIERGYAAAPEVVVLDHTAIWPFADVLATNHASLVTDLDTFADSLPIGAWDRQPQQAVVMPIAAQGPSGRAGILVVGLNPYRLFNDAYRGFLELVASQIGVSIANAQAYEDERKRAEALAELDRAKTAFFSNVSHEFRTPLTLMLGPLEDTLAQADGLSAEDRERLDVAHHNALRLLRLVNTLLDFSRIEAGRVQATFAPTDLAAFTADLASVFRSAVERAGLRLMVSCPPLDAPIYVDQEMWEKVVLNLLSNAFKFTFTGEIAVSLQQVGTLVELQVRDTGTGIPADQLPHLFERFHRVDGARGRTFEGSGIGLALVQELVKLHGGSVRVASAVDQGSTFTVTIPLGSAHLPADRIVADGAAAPTIEGSAAYVDEALRWLPEDEESRTANREPRTENQEPRTENQASGGSQFSILGSSPKILLADDNPDMRAYVRRLLSQSYEVVAVGDGATALRLAQETRFDLVLTDVMMPELDGFGLLRALRADQRTGDIPVILLSARAGEESRIEGLDAGADDYLTKPFSARELLARIRANLELARIRREAAQREQQLRAAAEQVKEQLERILEGIQDDFVMYDNDWRYVYVNDKAAQMLGYSKDELIGQRIWDLFPSTVGNLFYHEMHRAKAEGRDTVFEHYYEPWRKWIENRTYPMPEGMLLFATDITERKRAEAEREQLLQQERQLRVQADEASRLKDEFLATVSHELRTPLTAFLGYAQMLQRRIHDQTYVARTAERMIRSAKNQAQLIEDLLDVSRIVSGKLRIEVAALDLRSVVYAALDTLRPAIDAKGLQVNLDLHPAASAIIGDPNRLQQVVWNLLSNATKFTPSGGSIQVRLVPREREAQLTISDTGQGISADFLPVVFDRFRQADGSSTRAQGGLGLGLAIVRHLVEFHGGAVEAASEGAGRGATFTVRLPLRSSDLDGLSDSAGDMLDGLGADEKYPPELQGLRVLVVDDQPDILELVQEILGVCGAVVRTCTTAREALETILALQPQILISDIAMPNEDGYWLIDNVRALAPEDGGSIPAIALTAYVRVEERVRVLAAGYQLYVPKPVDPDELRNVVAQLAGTIAAE